MDRWQTWNLQQLVAKFLLCAPGNTHAQWALVNLCGVPLEVPWEWAWILSSFMWNHHLFCFWQSSSAMPFLFCWLNPSDGCSNLQLPWSNSLYISDGESRNWHVRLIQQLLTAANIHSFVGLHQMRQLCPSCSLLILFDSTILMRRQTLSIT